MQAVFDAIAGSTTLQALSILITFGGFFIFIFKLLVPAIKFVNNSVRLGVRRAYIRALRPVFKRVRRDARHGYLLILSLFSQLFLALLGLGLLPIMMITLQITERSLERLDYVDTSAKLTGTEAIFSFMLGLPIGLAVAWITLYPSLRFMLYCAMMRRHILRGLLAASKSRTQP